MTSGYVYGSYLNFQANLDPGKTKSRYQAKWRSQIPVRLDLGFHLTVAEDQYWRIKNTTDAGDENFLVNLVHIDDLDFQIKSTLRVDDFFWIYKAPVPIIGGRAPIGKNLSIRDTYVPVERNLDTSNPNSDRFTAPVLVARAAIVPTFIDFAEERLELGYDYGAVGGPEFKTEVVEVASGRETRNSLWHLPLGRWQLGDRMVADSEEDKLTEVSYLKSFHEARRGSYQGFRYKDWADYYARDQHIATGDGVRTEFQLRKAYRAGDAVTYRPIQKPVFGTVDLFVDGINVAVDPEHEWTVNHSKGVISHPEPLIEGAVLTANFEFDVPVWFESDEIGFSLQAYEPESGDSIYLLESVFVVEGRIPLTLPWQIQEAVKINQPLDLGVIYDTIEKHSFLTDKLTLANNFTRKEIKREDTKNVFDIGDRTFDLEELDRLLGYFWNARGMNFKFRVTSKQKKYIGQFNSEQLNIKFEAAAFSKADGTNDALYSLSGLKLDLVPHRDTIFNLLDKNAFLYVFIDTSGSMDNSIPAIESAIAEFKVLLKDRIYGTSEATNAKVFLINFSDERWLKLFTTYYQKSAVYLIWINEALPSYHSGSYAPPTTNYQSDLIEFLSSYDERTKFKAEIYSITFNSPAFIEFQSHLEAAHQGTEGYSPALVKYNVNINLDVDPQTSAAQYFQQFSET